MENLVYCHVLIQGGLCFIIYPGLSVRMGRPRGRGGAYNRCRFHKPQVQAEAGLRGGLAPFSQPHMNYQGGREGLWFTISMSTGNVFPRHRWGNWVSRWGLSNWDSEILLKVTQLVSTSWIKPGSVWCQSHTLSTMSPSAFLHRDAPQCPCAIDRNKSYYR